MVGYVDGAPRNKSVADKWRFNNAKDKFENLRSAHERVQSKMKTAKRQHSELKQEYTKLKDELEQIQKAQKDRITELKQQRNYRDRNFPEDGTYYGEFQGQPAKIKISDSGNSNRMDIYIGGRNRPDGKDHDHILAKDGNIDHWRENGEIIIDDGKSEHL